MAKTDSSVQIIPFYAQPHVHTVITDDSFYDETVAARADSDDLPFATCVVTGADRGIDNTFVRVNNKQTKDAIFGKANFAKYGQASIQADVLFNGKTDVWFCRALPDDATYSNLIVLANFRKGKVLNAENQETGLYQLEIKFSTAYAAKPYVTNGATNENIINQVATSMTKLVEDPQTGYLTLPLFYTRAIGRGKYGNEYSMSMSRDTEAENDYDMKMYTFNLISNGTVTRVVNQFSGSLYQTTKYNMSTLISDVLDQFSTGSCPISIIPFEDSWETLYTFYTDIVAANAAYIRDSKTTDTAILADLAAAKEIAIDTFDPIFGLRLNTRTNEIIPYYRNYTQTEANSWVEPDYVVSEDTKWEQEPSDEDLVMVDGICYSSMAEAITAAEDGATVKFVANITQSAAMSISKDVTLDLNGKSMTFDNENAYLNVTGNEVKIVIENGSIVNKTGRALQASNGATIVLGDGAVVDSDFTGSIILSGANIEIDDGASINNGAKNGIQAQAGSHVVMNGGKVTATASGAYAIKAIGGSTIEINGGDISGGTGALYVSDTTGGSDGSITISGGNIKSETYGVVMFDTTKLVINDGKISGVAGLSTNGKAENVNGKIEINGGTIEGSAVGIYLPNGTMTVKGGTIAGPMGVVVRGGNLEVTGGTITGTSNQDENIGDTKYTAKAAAISIDKNKNYSSSNVNVKISGGTILGLGGKAIAYTEDGVDCTANCDKDADTCEKCKNGIEGLTITGGKMTGIVICDHFPKGAWSEVTAPVASTYNTKKPVAAVATLTSNSNRIDGAIATAYAVATTAAIANVEAPNVEDVSESNRQKKPVNVSVWNEAFVGARVMVYADPLNNGQRYIYTVTAINDNGEIIYDEGAPVAIDAEQYTGLDLSQDVGHMFSGGSDGAFQEITVDGITRAPTAAEMKLLLSKEYVRIFRGEKDRKILSPARVNLDFMFDANYNMTTGDELKTNGPTDVFSGNSVLTDADNQALSVIGGTAISMNFTDLNVKKAMYDLNEFRNKNGMTINPAMGAGCSLYLDCNLTGLKSVAVSYELMNVINSMSDMDGRATSIDLGFYEIFDPVSSKRIKVTTSYFIAKNLVPHLIQFGLNKPFTNNFARLKALQRDNSLTTSGDMIRDSFRPDIDLIDWDVKEALYNSRINYYISSKEGRIVQRATQNTRQMDASALLEENNVRVLNTLKKGLESACQSYLYEWNNPEARKGYTTAQMDIYRPWIGTMVEDLEIKFEANEWEQNRMIMHCYCIVKFRDIVKRIILEINIQRPTYQLES